MTNNILRDNLQRGDTTQREETGSIGMGWDCWSRTNLRLAMLRRDCDGVRRAIPTRLLLIGCGFGLVAWLGRTHVAPAGRRAGLMQIESSVASEAGGPVYRPIGVRGRRLLNVVFACRPLGLFDVHCEEGACSLSHDICRDSGDGVYEFSSLTRSLARRRRRHPLVISAC